MLMDIIVCDLRHLCMAHWATTSQPLASDILQHFTQRGGLGWLCPHHDLPHALSVHAYQYRRPKTLLRLRQTCLISLIYIANVRTKHTYLYPLLIICLSHRFCVKISYHLAYNFVCVLVMSDMLLRLNVELMTCAILKGGEKNILKP